MSREVKQVLAEAADAAVEVLDLEERLALYGRLAALAGEVRRRPEAEIRDCGRALPKPGARRVLGQPRSSWHGRTRAPCSTRRRSAWPAPWD